MYKLVTIFCLLAAVNACGQSNNIVVSENQSSGSAINIAVSSFDNRNGDDFFTEADQTEKKGDLNNALTLFGKAAFEYNSSHQFNNYGSALLRLSNVHMMLNNFTEAEQVVLNVALKNYSRIHNVQGQLDSYRQLSKIYLAADKLTEAMWFSTQQGILARRVKSDNGYMESMLGIANVKIRRKQFKLAKKDLAQVELFAKTTNNTRYRSEISYARNQISAQGNSKKL
jgi:tetratricopeptide (TPR) repeat protein